MSEEQTFQEKKKKAAVFSDVVWEVTQQHSHHTLLVKAIITSSDLREENVEPVSQGQGCQ